MADFDFSKLVDFLELVGSLKVYFTKNLTGYDMIIVIVLFV